jgi:hypothetical protein
MEVDGVDAAAGAAAAGADKESVLLSVNVYTHGNSVVLVSFTCSIVPNEQWFHSFVESCVEHEDIHFAWYAFWTEIYTRGCYWFPRLLA